MRLIDADDIDYESIDSSDTSRYEYYYGTGIMAVRKEDIDAMPTIEERKSTIEFPHVFIAEGYDSIKSEDGETGFGVYDPENKQIFIAGAVPDEIFVKALLHELMHWVQDISGYAFNEDEANTFAENIYNTMESYIVTNRWIPCSERLPENDDRVLATTEWGDVTIAERIYPPINDTCWFIHDGNTNATIDDVIAWMPLPEPYKERREE